VTDQFVSLPVFGNVIKSDKSEFLVMIKLKPESKKIREKLNIDLQFITK
jgi:hypothetical protein